MIFMHISWIFYARETTLVSHSRGLSQAVTFVPMGKARQFAHPNTVNHKVTRPFHLCYGDLMEPFTSMGICSYKYASKVTDEYTKWTAVCFFK